VKKKVKKLKKTTCILISLIVAFVAGCAPKVKVVDEEVIKSVEAVEKKDELYAKAYSEGYEACNAEWFERLKVEVENLKRQKMWNKYLAGGYVKPPKIAEVYVPAEVSPDGKTLALPKIEYVIVEDAMFEPRSLVERLTKQTTTVFLGLFFTEDEYEKRLAEVEKFLNKNGLRDEVEIRKAPAVDGSGNALLLRTEDRNVAKIIIDNLGGQVIY
jgi:hypothetical protein